MWNLKSFFFEECNNDTDDDCTSNVHDCEGVCDGDSWISDCGCVAFGNSGNEVKIGAEGTQPQFYLPGQMVRINFIFISPM